MQKAHAVASDFKADFEKGVQYVFSWVQHHGHELRDGKRVPLNYCSSKKKGRSIYAAAVLHSRKCMLKARVVCPCVAKEHGLKMSGRKNMLGSVPGRRRCAWFNGCNSSCAALLRCSSHIMPNFRVSRTSETAECAGACLSKDSVQAGADQEALHYHAAGNEADDGLFHGYITSWQDTESAEL